MLKALLPLLLALPVWAERLPTVKVDTRPVLQVVTENFPPFQYELNGKIVGPMYDYMVQSCNLAGINCQIAMLPWKDTISKAEKGEADVIFSILLGVKEREDRFYTSPPVVATAYSFFVASKSDWMWVGDFNDLEGMTVGTYGPSGTSIVATGAVSQTKTARLVVERTNLTAFHNLVAGVYGPNAAVVVNRDVGRYLLAANNISGPKLAGTLKEVHFGIGFSRNSPNQYLRSRLMGAAAAVKKRDLLGNSLSVEHPPERRAK